MPSKYTYLFAVAKYLNDMANLDGAASKEKAIDKIREVIISGMLTDQLKENKLVDEMYSSMDLVDEVSFYEAVEGFFSNEDNLKKFIRESPEGEGYELVFADHISLLFVAKDGKGAPRDLKVEDLPADVKLINSEGKPVDIDSDYEFDSAHLMVHYKDENGNFKNGILKVEDIIAKLPTGVREGFYDRDSGHTFHNIYLCDSNGVYLNSRIEIQGDGNNKKFSVRENDKWYAAFASTASEDNKRDDLYVAFGIDTSVQYLCFLQKTEVSLSKGKIYEKYFPKESIKYLPKSSYNLIHELVELVDFRLTPDAKDDLEFKSNLISHMVYQFDKWYALAERYSIG